MTSPKLSECLRSKVLGILMLGASVVLPAIGSIGAAEKTVVPRFRNVDEAIGWVKAKGTCEKIGKDQKGSRCKIRVELPEEKRGEISWQVWAWMEALDLEPLWDFSVNIVRSRNFPLSASDPKTTVRSVKVSRYQFDKSSKITWAYIKFVLENFKGEIILDQEIPIPKDSVRGYGEWGYDFSLLIDHLGMGWNYH